MLLQILFLWSFCCNLLMSSCRRFWFAGRMFGTWIRRSKSSQKRVCPLNLSFISFHYQQFFFMFFFNFLQLSSKSFFNDVSLLLHELCFFLMVQNHMIEMLVLLLDWKYQVFKMLLFFFKLKRYSVLLFI